MMKETHVHVEEPIKATPVIVAGIEGAAIASTVSLTSAAGALAGPLGFAVGAAVGLGVEVIASKLREEEKSLHVVETTGAPHDEHVRPERVVETKRTTEVKTNPITQTQTSRQTLETVAHPVA